MSAPMVRGTPQVFTPYMMGAMKAKEDARKMGTLPRVTIWKISVPTPAVKKATLLSSPVSSGTSTSAPKATKSICAPSSASRRRKT